MNDPALRIIEIQLLPALAVAAVWIVVLLIFLLPKREAGERKGGGAGFHGHSHDDSVTGEPDWAVPQIDATAGLTSPFHQWDARVKIAALIGYAFCVAFLQQLVVAAVALAASVGAIYLSKLPWRRPLARLAAMAGFLGMFLIVMPFTVPVAPGDTLITLPPLTAISFKVSGFLLALLIVVKASAIAMIMEPLLATAPFTVTVQGLSRLGAPSMICQMLLLSHRYIFVFLHEIKRMARSMRVRGFRSRTNLATLEVYGNFLGMLFVRSFDRTQRVYDAMLCRGYNGAFPTFFEFNATRSDWAKGCFWVGLGLALIVFDHLL